MKKISYVFPIYNEEGNINLLHKKVSEVVKKLESNYKLELVFVNDGSRDKSLALLQKLAQKDPRMVIVDFSRNFGHQVAVTAGIEHASGDAVIIMDSDLQDPPAVSLDLVKKWEEGYEVVYAQRQSRTDPVLKKIFTHIYYRLLHSIASIEIPRNTGDFRLIDRRIVDELKLYGEHDRFLRGMISNIGFSQIGVLYKRDGRHEGESNYPLKKLIKLATDGIMGFSMYPLQLISRVGYLFTGLSIAGALYALIARLFTTTQIAGWFYILISVFFVGGVQVIILGLLGGYVGRIYFETKNRPLYTIRKVYRSGKK